MLRGRLPPVVSVVVVSLLSVALGVAAGLGGAAAVRASVHVTVPRSLFHRAVGDLTVDGVMASSLPEGARQAATCLVGGEWFRAQVSWPQWGPAEATDVGRPTWTVSDPNGSVVVALPLVLDGDGADRVVVFGHVGPDVVAVRARFGRGSVDQMRPVEGWFALSGVRTGMDIRIVGVRRHVGSISVWVPATGRAGATKRCLSAP